MSRHPRIGLTIAEKVGMYRLRVFGWIAAWVKTNLEQWKISSTHRKGVDRQNVKYTYYETSIDQNSSVSSRFKVATSRNSHEREEDTVSEQNSDHPGLLGPFCGGNNPKRRPLGGIIPWRIRWVSEIAQSFVRREEEYAQVKGEEYKPQHLKAVGHPHWDAIAKRRSNDNRNWEEWVRIETTDGQNLITDCQLLFCKVSPEPGMWWSR